LIVPPDRREEFSAIMEKLKRGELVERYETQRRHKDGRILKVSLTITPLKDRQGQVVGAMSIAYDITAAKALQLSGDRFMRLMGANIIGVVIVEGDYIVEANDAFLKLVGYTREDLEQRAINWIEMTPPEYEAANQRALEELRTRGVSPPFEKEYVRKNGSRVPMLITPVRFQEEPLQWMTLVLDLTAQKELERRKGELVTMASHELRTPLTSIKGYLEVVLS
jgi:PAS domain S-box-containing protein